MTGIVGCWVHGQAGDIGEVTAVGWSHDHSCRLLIVTPEGYLHDIPAWGAKVIPQPSDTYLKASPA